MGDRKKGRPRSPGRRSPIWRWYASHKHTHACRQKDGTRILQGMGLVFFPSFFSRVPCGIHHHQPRGRFRSVLASTQALLLPSHPRTFSFPRFRAVRVRQKTCPSPLRGLVITGATGSQRGLLIGGKSQKSRSQKLHRKCPLQSSLSVTFFFVGAEKYFPSPSGD